ITPGIPYVHTIDGVQEHALTVFCGHTIESLRRFGDVGAQVELLSEKLRILTWGTPATHVSEGTPALFELPGMKTNLRSKNNVNLTPGNGSFNLASTHGEGEGHGVFLPAVQTAVPAAAERIQEVLQVLHGMYRLIMPCCVSKFEWEMMEFKGMDNNVMACGGLEPGVPSVQCNASETLNTVSTDKELSDDIGGQGKMHEDKKDDPEDETLVCVMVKLAPGSDPGLFMSEAQAIWKRTSPQNRVAYVMYPSNSGKNRNTHLAVTPPLHFGNAGAPIPHLQGRKNFAVHGRTILGDQRAYSNRLGREAFFLLKNFLAHSKLALNLNINQLLENTTYTDPEGNVHSLEAIPHDIEDDEQWAWICLMRRYSAYYR
ncbi:hypothetical protein B0H11DRAFT_1632372, partial [Mycena galericulata]